MAEPAELSIVIVGSGFAGLGMAIRLKSAITSAREAGREPSHGRVSRIPRLTAACFAPPSGSTTTEATREGFGCPRNDCAAVLRRGAQSTVDERHRSRPTRCPLRAADDARPRRNALPASLRSRRSGKIVYS